MTITVLSLALYRDLKPYSKSFDKGGKWEKNKDDCYHEGQMLNFKPYQLFIGIYLLGRKQASSWITPTQQGPLVSGL